MTFFCVYFACYDMCTITQKKLKRLSPPMFPVWHGKQLYSSGVLNSIAETEATVKPSSTSLHFPSFLIPHRQICPTDLNKQFTSTTWILRCDARRRTPCCPWLTLPGQLNINQTSFSVNLLSCLKIITDYGYSVITSIAKWALSTSNPYLI